MTRQAGARWQVERTPNMESVDKTNKNIAVLLAGRGHWLLPLATLLLQGWHVALLVESSKNLLGGEAGAKILHREFEKRDFPLLGIFDVD